MKCIIAAGAMCAATLAGCQTYEPSPLRLNDHRAALDDRLLDTTDVGTFAAQLRGPSADAPLTFDLGDGVSPAEGETLALFHNADLRLARLEANVAQASFDHAGLWDDPVFGFNAAEILSSSAPSEYGGMLNLTLPVSGRLAMEKDRAGAALETELRRIIDKEWSTRHAVRKAWTAWTIAQRRVDLLREVVQDVDRVNSITEQLEAAGELSRVESRLFRVESADRRAALAQAELAARRVRIELLGLMGLPPQTDVDLLAEFPNVEQQSNDDEYARLIAANTQLAVRRAAYQTTEQSLRLAIRKQYPDITIGGGYGTEGDDRLLLGLSVPIPILNANRKEIAEARAKRDLARAAAETTYERLARELAAARAELDAARAQHSSYEQSIIPMLAEQSNEVKRLAELGEVNTLLLLETVTRQFGAKSRLLELRQAELDSAIAISELLGPDPILIGGEER